MKLTGAKAPHERTELTPKEQKQARQRSFALLRQMLRPYMGALAASIVSGLVAAGAAGAPPQPPRAPPPTAAATAAMSSRNTPFTAARGRSARAAAAISKKPYSASAALFSAPAASIKRAA